jgi:hypothetical protein
MEYRYIILILLRKISDGQHFLGRFSAAALGSVALAGCISSGGPILTDAKPVLGPQGEIHLYTVADGGARDPSVVSFRWNGSRYLFRGRGRAQDVSDFTVHPYEGRDLIVQSTAARAPRPTEYALARRLTEGAYLIVPIDENDADEATRAKFCTKTQDAACRVTTPEQLFVFAKATAAKVPESGGLAVVLPSGRR